MVLSRPGYRFDIAMAGLLSAIGYLIAGYVMAGISVIDLVLVLLVYLRIVDKAPDAAHSKGASLIIDRPSMKAYSTFKIKNYEFSLLFPIPSRISAITVCRLL